MNIHKKHYLQLKENFKKLNTPDEALECIEQAIKDAGYKPGEDIHICLDAADHETKLYEVEVGVKKNGDEMIKYLEVKKGLFD